MDDIKSAYEIAMEKAERLGRPSEEDVNKWKYVPLGQEIARGYLNNERNLVAEVGNYDEDVRRHVIAGAQETLLRNLEVPRNDSVRRNNKRAMEGIKTLKSDKASIENVYSKMRRIFEHYEQQGEQQRRQAYEELKMDFEQRLQQALRQQPGTPARGMVNVEAQPQFQEEWRRTLLQLDSQYHKLLDEYRQEILAIL
jgi:hypothetical protein